MSYSHRFFLLWLALVLGSTKMFTSRTLAAAICCNQLDQGATRQFLSREAFLEIFEKRSQNIVWFTVALINLRESRSTIANNLVLRSWFHGPSGVHFDKAAEESRQELKDRELRLQVDGWDAGMKINEDMSMQIESVSYRNTWRSGEVLRISMIHHALFSLSIFHFFASFSMLALLQPCLASPARSYLEYYQCLPQMCSGKIGMVLAVALVSHLTTGTWKCMIDV